MRCSAMQRKPQPDLLHRFAFRFTFVCTLVGRSYTLHERKAHCPLLCVYPIAFRLFFVKRFGEKMAKDFDKQIFGDKIFFPSKLSHTVAALLPELHVVASAFPVLKTS